MTNATRGERVIRVGIDVGGTFTDIVTLDERSGATAWLKVPTVEREPARSVLAAIAASGTTPARSGATPTASGTTPARSGATPTASGTTPAVSGATPALSHVRLGSTVGVNTVLTRSGAPTGLLTTKGFRDVLEIRRTHRERLFDLEERPPEPLVPRDLRVEVQERIDADGNEVTPLDEQSVRAAWRQLRARGVRTLAIVFLFSFENPAHELRAKELVLEEGGAEAVFASCEVLPVHREYERTSTTVLAAYVAPAIERHLTELAAHMHEDGSEHAQLAVLTSAGGVRTAAALTRNPIPSLLSGPAGGVTGALRLATQAGLRDVLTLDMGGTSCDVSGIVDGAPDERLDTHLAGLAMSHPTFDIHTIGAGGGSIAWVDSGGALRVGPHSAGCDPGPACYGRGGEQPTVTDAQLVLGRYEPGFPLGGTLSLDPELARAAIERHVAEPLDLSVERAAAGVVRIVDALMAGAVRTISLERGRDPRDFTLMAFGGAGPVHAADVAGELGVRRILVPPCPGCTSALGAVIADSRRDELRTLARRVEDVSTATLEAIVGDLEGRVREALAQEGFTPAGVELELWLDLRYEGQAHALAVRVGGAGPAPAAQAARPGPAAPEAGLAPAGDGVGTSSPPVPVPATESPGPIAAAAEAFHALHHRLYGHSFDDVPVEVVNVRATGYGRVRNPTPRWRWSDTPAAASAKRPVYFEQAGRFLDTRVLRREDVGAEAIEGPAVIHQLDATVLVPPGLTAAAHPSGSLILEREASVGRRREAGGAMARRADSTTAEEGA
jgi:N-methylhydantoinase A